MHRVVEVTVPGDMAVFQRALSGAGFTPPHGRPGSVFATPGWGHVGPVTARTVFAYRWGPRLADAAHPTVFHPHRSGESRLTPPEPGAEPTAGFEPGCDRRGALEHLGWAVWPDGSRSLLCPDHQVAERERAYARRMAEWGVRSDFRRFVSALPPHAYLYLPDIR
ncbi:hypothetical protein Q8791_22930 [Nocardiopsis sp. CT-R113]|uniref:Uncharacterized protein n=1 Tax=Nocardiopsis codii TaxID=3065942 RepID=A0ABU7KCW9_9ACTN|nr:hypothetical protein [Nocardiopsis sp. CT-R113]MEE2040075.1 hypothetical protein [Nocardiopsis sp. CT-R113]